MGRSEFEVMDGQSTEQLAGRKGGKQSSCQLTVVTGFILVLLAIAISVGVALIVFFAVKPGSNHLNCTLANGDQVFLSDYHNVLCNVFL